MPFDTFGSILDRHRGEGPGFGILRLGLAVAVLYDHARFLSRLDLEPTTTPPGGIYYDRAAFSPSHILVIFIVPAFFALSGFLVTGSAMRLRATVPFLTFRLLRILPALFIEVTLSALILGPLFTKLPLASYFSDAEFFRYFGNIVGWITFYLPGVFEANRVSTVNANLWTLPAEFDCYFITATLLLSRLAYNRTALTAIMLAVTAIFIGLNTFSNFGLDGFPHTGATITYYFFMGMMFFHWKEYISSSWLVFVLAAISGYVLMGFHHTIYLAPIFITYVTIFLGVRALPELKWLRTRDYSYGIYLYGFPITQALLAMSPALRGHGYVTFAIGVSAATIFAAASWHLIERPALALKSRLPALMTARRMPVAIAGR